MPTLKYVKLINYLINICVTSLFFIVRYVRQTGHASSPLDGLTPQHYSLLGQKLKLKGWADSEECLSPKQAGDWERGKRGGEGAFLMLQKLVILAIYQREFHAKKLTYYIEC